MNIVIAPVDFSPASDNALLFAVEICKRSSSRLLIVNISGTGKEEEAKAVAGLQRKKSEIEKITTSGLFCETLALHGSLTTVLTKLIDDRNPSLVVMGTKGASGLKKILIGSNTVNLLAKTKAPVLVIPEKATFNDFLLTAKNRIVLATDLHGLTNMNVLSVIKEMALLMKEPKVRVLNVRPPHTELYDVTKLERSAIVHYFNPEINSEYATVFGNTVMGGIKFYLDDHPDTGLVAMIANDSGALIEKHYSREMASHTDYPLLVLHDVK